MEGNALMAIHESVDVQPATAFAGAQRASKYIEGSAAPILAAGPLEPADEVSSTIVPDLSQPEATANFVVASGTDAQLPPEEEAVDLGMLSVSAPVRVAQRGARGMLAKLGMKVSPSAAEKAATEIAERQRQHEDIVRQATWTRAVSILIANPKGGVGKTPTALLLGGVLAAVRGGSVCIMEVSDDPGALTFRSEGAPTRGLGELVRDAGTIRSAGQLAGYTAPQTSFAAVVGSIGSRPRLEGVDVTAVATVVDDYFSIRVMDSGNQPSSSAFQAAVEMTDILVVPTFDAGDAALEAAALLDTLREAGGKSAALADTAIVLRLHDCRPEKPQVIKRVDSILSSHGIEHVHTIPYDGHIAERGQLSLAKLAAPTRRAITAAAADVVTTLQTNVR
jgi:MinD-like ATPase involved in chromosome partitioning or flagellar assembly